MLAPAIEPSWRFLLGHGVGIDCLGGPLQVHQRYRCLIVRRRVMRINLRRLAEKSHRLLKLRLCAGLHAFLDQRLAQSQRGAIGTKPYRNLASLSLGTSSTSHC